jgi:hypothetical protein
MRRARIPVLLMLCTAAAGGIGFVVGYGFRMFLER